MPPEMEHMFTSAPQTVSYIDLVHGAAAYLRNNMREIFLSLSIGLLMGLLVAHFTHPDYRAVVTVSAQEGISVSGSGLGNLSDLAGLASSAGVGGDSMLSSSFQPFQRFTQTLTNDTVADKLVHQPWVLPAMFPQSWDQGTKSWRPSSWLTSFIYQLGHIVLGTRAWHPPDADDLQDLLDSHINVEKLGRYPAYTISLKWRDPEIARRILTLIMATNDNIIQMDAQTRLSGTVGYLQARLDTEVQVSRRNALNQILVEQERSLMAAESEHPYAAKIIDRMAVSMDIGHKLIFGGLTLVLFSLLSFYGITLARRHRFQSNFSYTTKTSKEAGDSHFSAARRNPQ